MPETAIIVASPMQLLEDQFRTFETAGEWRLSLPAKVVIQQGFISLNTQFRQNLSF
jgi:hypothetical protein